MPEETISLVGFLKVLADESRLRILGILASHDASVDELAAGLNLKAPTISHHLARLRDLGLVSMRTEGNSHVYHFRPETLATLNQRLTPRALSEISPDPKADAWKQKVLRDFFEGQVLKEIPASRKKRQVVLQWLAGQFHLGTRYPEAQVNEIIRRHHPDFATLRRELIAARLMDRESGIYWLRNPDPCDA